MRASDEGCSVERAADVGETPITWVYAISRRAETVEHFLFAVGRDAEDRTLVILAAFERRAVKRALDVDESRHWVCAVSAVLETIEYLLRAGWRDREDGPAAATGAAVRAPLFGRAVERAIDVEETRLRVEAVWVALETMEHGLLLAGYRDREDRTVPVRAP